MSDLEREMVIVLDFGGQYSQLIARRIRELKVFCEMLPFNTPLPEIKSKNPRGIVFSGGPSSVYEDGAPSCDPAIYDLGIPILGICYGMHLMAHQLGGVVVRSELREYGKTAIEVTARDELLCCMDSTDQCW
ncbi:MAG: GMP synthase (glutamine-hydrolyzing), partial [Pirellulales bacterium]|nr:GMP synthase (glutamine-hydrolyzing) [Pirellulales bacterium]